MKSLCKSGAETQALDKLLTLVSSGRVKGTEAWALFSQPMQTKTLNSPPRTFNFSPDEVDIFKELRRRTSALLYERFYRACAYCRRPVGHYGYSWHIEHVIPKSHHSQGTFDLSNLAVGCVDCNRWKGVRVDKQYNGILPIINPVGSGFRYGKHMHYVHFSTEEICFAKYLPQDEKGKVTYKRLSFEEIERATMIDSMNELVSRLHMRIDRILGSASENDSSSGLASLLVELKSAIYRRN
jgi:hypothetical protein